MALSNDKKQNIRDLAKWRVGVQDNYQQIRSGV